MTQYYWRQAGELYKITHQVKQEVPADGIVLDQMSSNVCGSMGGKGHQEISSCYCQGTAYGRKRGESGESGFCLGFPLAHLTLQQLVLVKVIILFLSN